MRKTHRDLKNEAFVQVPLTSMMDVFTILLFFLLSSFSVSEFKLTPPKDIQLPKSISEKEPEVALTAVASLNAIFLEGKMVAPLVNMNIEPQYLDKNDSLVILPLLDELKKYRKITRLKEKIRKDFAFSGKLILQADKNLPFDIIKRIMYTSEKENYVVFKFATFKVVKK